MKKKMFLVSLAAMGLLALSACSSSNTQKLDDDLVTLKGGSITIGDYYDEIKATNASTLQNMVIYKVFDNAYGDKVTDKSVQKKYDEMEKGYGGKEAFDAALKQNGYTEKTYKAYVKQQLAFEKGMKSNVKLKDADLKTAWESFHPEVEAQIIQLADEDSAKEVKAELDKGGDFTKLAKDKSTADTASKGGTIKFSSSSTDVPAEVMSAAFALEDGKVSDILSATDSNYATTYYIVKMVKNADKGNDMDKYKKEVKEAATTAKLADSAFQNEVITKELKAANVKIKDNTFSDLLANYLTSSDSSDAKESSSKESSSKESSSKESSTEESSSTADSSTAESTSDSAQ